MSRDNLDRYYTPDALADRLVGRIADRLGDGMILEPSCGGGAFLRALLARDLPVSSMALFAGGGVCSKVVRAGRRALRP